jgi:hypothetical protein
MSRTLSLVLVVLGVILLLLAAAAYFVASIHFFAHEVAIFGVLGVVLAAVGIFGMVTGRSAA